MLKLYATYVKQDTIWWKEYDHLFIWMDKL